MVNHIVLFEPRIHFNTGNIARTAAATNTVLHLIEPFGFEITDKHLKRAGLDYWDKVDIRYHKNLEDFLETCKGQALYLITKFAEKTYSEIDYQQIKEDIYFIFGREDTGLPENFMRLYKERCLRLPMNDEHVRSLNLSNCAAIMIYELLRQQNFSGLESIHHYEKDKLK
ncbi:MAG: tRNA (cytidine(34)-2'-O)-methyltransferase [Lactovum sp.]